MPSQYSRRRDGELPDSLITLQIGWQTVVERRGDRKDKIELRVLSTARVLNERCANLNAAANDKRRRIHEDPQCHRR